MKRAFLAVFAAVSCGMIAFGAPLTVSWVEGLVDIKAGSGWKAIDAGDTVDSAASVRLGPGSFAEFMAGKRKIAVSAEGVYVLDSLLSASASQEAARVTVVGKMGRFVNTQAPRNTVVAGVRGDFEGAPANTTWVVDEDDPATIAEEARALAAKDQFDAAATKFAAAADGALGDKRDEYRYSQAWCLAAANNPIGAIKILRPMASGGSYGIARGILLARLNLDTGAAKEALALLDEVAKNPSLAGEDAALVEELRKESRAALGVK